MATFVVVLNKPDADVKERVAQSFPSSSYEISPVCFLVRSSENARFVAEVAGVRPRDEAEEGTPLGVVFSLNGSFSGFNDVGLWEWLKNEPT